MVQSNLHYEEQNLTLEDPALGKNFPLPIFGLE